MDLISFIIIAGILTALLILGGTSAFVMLALGIFLPEKKKESSK
jgi:hypothetical protein